MDTLKKANSLSTTPPIIYAKFIFTLLIEALQRLLVASKSIETLILEGLPISSRYMMTLVKGLYTNRSIKILSFSRSNIGDESCSILCSNIKHLSNIETLNLNNCNLEIHGAVAVKEFIKSQKIHRYSEAWTRSLRYQEIESNSLDGLRKIVVSNNPMIGDTGLEILTNELVEDAWIKEIDMQNCGLTDTAAKLIINCLNINKTIMNFNVLNNFEMPEYYQRQIMMGIIGQNDSINDMKCPQHKITKVQLLDKLKFVEEQLESEIFRRKQLEDLNNQLHRQVVESQNKLCLQEAFHIPEGYTLIENEELEQMLSRSQESVIQRNLMIAQKAALCINQKLRRRKRNNRSKPPKAARSLEMMENPQNESNLKSSKSESSFKNKTLEEKKKAFIEKNIGDYFHNTDTEIENDQTQSSSISGEMLLRSFSRSKKLAEIKNLDEDEILSTLFRKPKKNVHYTSDVDY